MGLHLNTTNHELKKLKDQGRVNAAFACWTLVDLPRSASMQLLQEDWENPNDCFDCFDCFFLRIKGVPPIPPSVENRRWCFPCLPLAKAFGKSWPRKRNHCLNFIV